jgi:S1-C subfamily serine protease
MRQHIEHLLAALGALAFALFVSYFNTGAVVHISPIEPIRPQLTPVAPDAAFAFSPEPIEFSTSTINKLLDKPTTTTKATPVKKPTPKTSPTTPTKPVPVLPKPVVPAPTPLPQPAATTTTTPEEPAAPASSGVLSRLKGSVVNILCTPHTSQVTGLSGSGVVIDSRGIILTVAHVAQGELLEQTLGSDVMSCVIRTGNPAQTKYKFKVVYIPEQWVKDNSTTLISSHPTGTGKNEFALLAITGTVSGSGLPSSFSSMPLTVDSPSTQEDVALGGYPAESLSQTQVRTALPQTVVTGTITKIGSLNGTSGSTISISGTSVGQSGASGGAIANMDGEVVGVIVGSYASSENTVRSVLGITPAYIRSMFTSATGESLGSYLGNSSPVALAESYSATAERLGQFIADAIGL